MKQTLLTSVEKLLQNSPETPEESTQLFDQFVDVVDTEVAQDVEVPHHN